MLNVRCGDFAKHFRAGDSEHFRNCASALFFVSQEKRHDSTDSPSKCTGKGVALGTWLGRLRLRNGPDAMGRHLAVECDPLPTRFDPLDVVRQGWRLRREARRHSIITLASVSEFPTGE